MTGRQPFVSVIMLTRDRPQFLSLALTCYARQTYAQRELIVVDDGGVHPADADAVAAAGGRLLRVPTGTPAGTKTNLAVAEARGVLCQHMDDDDWYAPQFMDRMVAGLLTAWDDVCRPTVAFLRPFLLFDLLRWQIRRSRDDGYAGATLFYARNDALAIPFRDNNRVFDTEFLEDLERAGAIHLPVAALESFLAVRHGGGGTTRGHTWTELAGGGSVDADMRSRPRYARGPETLLPAWAAGRYREIRAELLASRAPADLL